MGLVAKETGSARTPAPAGTHVATCFGLIDCGTQDEEYEGKKKKAHKVWVWWELNDEKTEDGKPVTIGRFYTNSLSERAAMRKDLEGWRGRQFTDEELKGFQLANIVGKPCLVTIIHTPKQGGGTRDKISSVTAVPKGMRPNPSESQIITLDLDEGSFNKPVYDSLPNFLKEMIAKSPEGRAALGLGGVATATAGHTNGTGQGDDDSEIPF
jgi:hypothetical protein